MTIKKRGKRTGNNRDGNGGLSQRLTVSARNFSLSAVALRLTLSKASILLKTLSLAVLMWSGSYPHMGMDTGQWIGATRANGNAKGWTSAALIYVRSTWVASPKSWMSQFGTGVAMKPKSNLR